MNNRTALVCGASQGIGEAVAHELAGLGCRVVAMARSLDKLEKVVAALPGQGHVALAHDIADRNGLTQRLTQIIENVGPIHILINNTGGPKPGPISEAEEETFVNGFANHVLAASALTRLFLPGMRQAGYGRIINVISTSVKIPIPNLGVSNTIRGAMANWAKTLASEVAADGITVNNVLPGLTATPRLANLIQAAATRQGKSVDEMTEIWKQMVPARRFAKPEETAAAVAFLASSAAAYINGINLPVDGGRTGCL